MRIPDVTDLPSLCSLLFGWLSSAGDGLTHVPNIFPAGYEIEGDEAAIS